MPSILFLTAYPIEDASCRHRVHQFTAYLQAAGYECRVSSFATTKLFRALRSRGRIPTKVAHAAYCALKRTLRLIRLSDFDIVVIHREAFPFLAPTVERWILRRHPRVLYSFDDAVYAGHGKREMLSHPFLYRAKHGRGYDEVIRRSYHVIAGNRVLAQHAAKLNPNVTVIPTVVDCERLWCKPARRSGYPVTIGWIGSRSTASYLAEIEPVLSEIAARNAGRVRFRIFGCPEYNLAVPGSQSLPFALDRESEDIRSLDIGLMPMPDNEWTRGKCAFKAIQYMSSGVPTIASPIGTITDLIQHNVNGLLVKSPGEWLYELERLIYDLPLCRRLALNARRTIEEKYSLQVWGPRLVSLFDKITRSEKVSMAGPVAA
jgi:glycosyltransferase involved in cell wall biosynthesis